MSGESALVDILGPLDGARIRGGCDDCDAYQEVEPVRVGVWIIHIHHDDWCPWWIERQQVTA